MLVPLRFTCLLLFTVIMLPSNLLRKANSETDYGCSVPNIDLQNCLNQSKNSLHIEDGCCKTLNQIAEAGFKCLCSLRTGPPIILSLSFLNCFISMPPLSLCPVLVAPESPKEQNQLSSSPPDVDVMIPHPPPTNLTVAHDDDDDDDDEHSVLPNGEQNSNTSMCLWLLALFLAFWVFIVV